MDLESSEERTSGGRLRGASYTDRAGPHRSPAGPRLAEGGKHACVEAKAGRVEQIWMRRGRPEGRGGLPRAAGTGYNKDQAAARSWVQQSRMEGDVGAPSKERE